MLAPSGSRCRQKGRNPDCRSREPVQPAVGPFTRDSTVFCDPHAAGAVSVSAVRVCTCFLSISDRDPFPAGHPVMAQLCKCGSQGSGHMQGGSECPAVPGGLGCGQRAAGFALGLLRASIVKVAVSFATGGVAPSPPSPQRNLRFISNSCCFLELHDVQVHFLCVHLPDSAAGMSTDKLGGCLAHPSTQRGIRKQVLSEPWARQRWLQALSGWDLAVTQWLPAAPGPSRLLLCSGDACHSDLEDTREDVARCSP